MPFLRQPTGVVATNRHPHVELIVEALDAPPEVRAPEFVFARDVAQRLERNGNLDYPAVRGHATFRFHHDVRIEVFAIIGPASVSLNSERIEIKLVSLAAVIKSIEE